MNVKKTQWIYKVIAAILAIALVFGLVTMGKGLQPKGPAELSGNTQDILPEAEKAIPDQTDGENTQEGHNETEPPETEPPETEPPETEPPETKPEETEPPKESISTSSIASQANAYAVTLGFVVDSSMTKSNSGYYSPDYRPLVTNAEGVAAAREMVAATKNQLNSRFSEGYSDTLVESIYGLVRVNVVVEFSHTDELGNWYYIYVLYG